MRLRSTLAVKWTTPPSRSDMDAMREIDAIDILIAADPDHAASLTQRRAELAATVAPAEQMRATLATMSALQFGRYEANRRALAEWIEQEAGITVTEAFKTEEWRELATLGVIWARTLAAITRLETRTISRLTDEAGEWSAIEIPAEWKTPGGYLDSAPHDLVQQMSAAAWDCNAELFDPSEDTKKNGGASVS